MSDAPPNCDGKLRTAMLTSMSAGNKRMRIDVIEIAISLTDDRDEEHGERSCSLDCFDRVADLALERISV